jgi:beta-mannanase
MSQNATGLTPFPLGVFVGNPNYYDLNEEAAFETNFSAFSTLMGAKPQFLDQYADQRLPISQWVGQASWNAASVAQSPVLHNVTPVIGLPMTSTAPGSGNADQFYRDFAVGKYDTVLKGMVKAWADNGFTTQIWRPGWEMNIDTMPSYAGNDAATRADWVKAFQHVSTVLHAAGQASGVSVQVMWNPSVVNYSQAGNVIQTAYPGNQYVDIIGADVYADLYPYGSYTHLYDWDKSGQVLNSTHPIFDTSLKQWAADPVNLQHYYTNPASNQWSLDGSVGHATTLQQFIDLAKSTGKPLAIAETGAGNTHDGAGVVDNPTFVKWLAQTLHQSGVKISFVNIWDSNAGGKYEFSHSSDGKPLEAAAWAKYFGALPLQTATHSSVATAADVNHLATGSAASGSTVKNDPPHSGSAAVNGHGSITIDPPHNEVHFNFAPVLDGSAASLVTGRAAGNNTSSFQHAGANSGYPDSSQNWLVSNGEHSNLIALANNDRSDHQSTAAGYDAALGPPSGVGPASGHDAQLHLGGFIIH